MDGNGRWAEGRGLPRKAGHRAGAESAREAVDACLEHKIEFLTLYAFSSENWNRPQKEINALMKLLEQFLKTKGKEFRKKKRPPQSDRPDPTPSRIMPERAC